MQELFKRCCPIQLCRTKCGIQQGHGKQLLPKPFLLFLENYLFIHYTSRAINKGYHTNPNVKLNVKQTQMLKKDTGTRGLVL